jgi:hypothetical protein
VAVDIRKRARTRLYMEFLRGIPTGIPGSR